MPANFLQAYFKKKADDSFGISLLIFRTLDISIKGSTNQS
jgi:hypothetical protein